MSYSLFSDQRPGHIVGTGCKCTRAKRCSVHRLPVTEKPSVRAALAGLRAAQNIQKTGVTVVTPDGWRERAREALQRAGHFSDELRQTL